MYTCTDTVEPCVHAAKLPKSIVTATVYHL